MRWTESYTYIVDISMTYDHHQQIFIEIPIFGVSLLYSVTKPPSTHLKSEETKDDICLFLFIHPL